MNTDVISYEIKKRKNEVGYYAKIYNSWTGRKLFDSAVFPTKRQVEAVVNTNIPSAKRVKEKT